MNKITEFEKSIGKNIRKKKREIRLRSAFCGTTPDRYLSLDARGETSAFVCASLDYGATGPPSPSFGLRRDKQDALFREQLAVNRDLRLVTRHLRLI